MNLNLAWKIALCNKTPYKNLLCAIATYDAIHSDFQPRDALLCISEYFSVEKVLKKDGFAGKDDYRDFKKIPAIKNTDPHNLCNLFYNHCNHV